MATTTPVATIRWSNNMKIVSPKATARVHMLVCANVHAAKEGEIVLNSCDYFFSFGFYVCSYLINFTLQQSCSCLMPGIHLEDLLRPWLGTMMCVLPVATCSEINLVHGNLI